MWCILCAWVASATGNANHSSVPVFSMIQIQSIFLKRPEVQTSRDFQCVNQQFTAISTHSRSFAAHARMDVHTRYAASSSLPSSIPGSTNHAAGRSILTPSVKSITIETPLQKRNLGNYIQKDAKYQTILNKQRNGHIQLAKQKKRDIEMYNIEKDHRHRLQSHYFGPGYRGPGNAPTNGPSQILYPMQKTKRFKSSELRV